jgi:hypothetical protein
MPGLTAKVFRTYNASITLDEKVSFKLRSITTLKLYNQLRMGHLEACEFTCCWGNIWRVNSYMRKQKMVMLLKKLSFTTKQTNR